MPQETSASPQAWEDQALEAVTELLALPEKSAAQAAQAAQVLRPAPDMSAAWWDTISPA